VTGNGANKPPWPRTPSSRPWSTSGTPHLGGGGRYALPSCLSQVGLGDPAHRRPRRGRVEAARNAVIACT